jgi:pyruvate/2-oxoglutarate dehydrogenase complex dihydrolipoamide acyltransferase (E2) component
VAKGSVRVKVGDVVKAGTPIARVGLSGQTEFPHLHLTVRHAGQMVDPFAPGPVAPGACAPQASMWTPAAARALAYKAGVILNGGFAGAPVSNETIEAGGIASPTSAWSAASAR